MPHIKTQRLELKVGQHPADLPAMVDWLNDEQLMRYSEQRHRAHTMQSQHDYINSFDYKNSFFWAIYCQSILVGSTTAYCDWPNQIADVGILIAPHSIKMGFGTEAWRGVCDCLIRHGIRKIEAGCMASNEGMIKIFGRTGMIIEGQRRAHFLLDGKPEAMIMAARFA